MNKNNNKTNIRIGAGILVFLFTLIILVGVVHNQMTHASKTRNKYKDCLKQNIELQKEILRLRDQQTVKAIYEIQKIDSIETAILEMIRKQSNDVKS